MNITRQASRAGEAFQIYTLSIHASPLDSMGRALTGIGDRRKDYRGADAENRIHAKKVGMYERTAQLQQLLVTWVVFINDQVARIYEHQKPTQGALLASHTRQYYSNQKSDNALLLIEDGVIRVESGDDLHADWCKPVLDAPSPVYGLYDPCSSFKEENKQHFITKIAHRLEESRTRNSFDRLVLVTSSSVISVLNDALSAGVRSCIVNSLR